MVDVKVKRTYYIPKSTIRNLNNFVVTHCTDDLGSTYGAASNIVTDAINTYITTYTDTTSTSLKDEEDEQ